MTRIDFYMVQNDQGQDLYKRHIQPICKRLGVEVFLPSPKATRLDSGASQFRAKFVLWDGSVEPGQIYNAMSTLALFSSKHIIIGRTPLPVNVTVHHQYAPIHGESLSNDELGEWLERYLPDILSGASHITQGAKDTNASLANYYWSSSPASVF